MEYNTQRPQLKITDYGRIVANMIESCKKIEDREKRNQLVNTIINVMAHVNPKIKERTDYKHILWDHLMEIANYQLDVDCPYEISQSRSTSFHPHKIERSKKDIRFRHYGRTTEDMIAALAQMPASANRDYLVEQVANTMKRQYLQWNRDTIDDQTIANQLVTLSNGQLKLRPDFHFKETQSYLDAIAAAQARKENKMGGKKKKKKKGKINL